jgi:hypothetical protein
MKVSLRLKTDTDNSNPTASLDLTAVPKNDGIWLQLSDEERIFSIDGRELLRAIRALIGDV